MFTAEQISRFVLQSYFTFLNRTCNIKGFASLPPRPRIIAMNHMPGCDSLYLLFILKEAPFFLLQGGLFNMPIIGWRLKKTGQIPVYRHTERAKEARERTCAMLRGWKTIAIFPEGKDVPRGQRIPTGTGAVRMSLETGTPIIPLGLYAQPQHLIDINFDWQGSPRSGAWQFSGRSYMRFGTARRPNPQSDLHVQTEELMDRTYSLVAEAERCHAQTHPPMINAITCLSIPLSTMEVCHG
jgi:1-acyl-sn-glycerol-3-phosphate acyltransferase